MQTTQERFHEHDCDRCTYLGSGITNQIQYDYYIHVKRTEEGLIDDSDLIARFDKDECYLCAPFSYVKADQDYPLSVAKRLYLTTQQGDAQ
ncbi:MAG: hypothetical protein ACXW0Q_04235 [Methylovulum sp.]